MRWSVVKSCRVSLVAAVTAAGASLGWAAPPAAATTPPIVVIVMENHSYNTIVGSSQAPFINSMIEAGNSKTNYFAVTKGSGHNYMAMTSGVTDRSVAKTAPNVFAALGNRTPWRTFQESMPSTCFKGSSSTTKVPGSSQPLYTNGHNPAMLYNNVAQTSLCQNVVPMDTAHFDPDDLPAFSYIAPNQCNDMHTQPSSQGCPVWDGTTSHQSSAIAYGDEWLSTLVPRISSHAIVILTFDEGCCGTEHIVTVLYGTGIAHHTDGTAYNHYGLEAGLYAYFQLGKAPGQGGNATPVPII